MAELLTAKSVHDTLRQYARERPDMGAAKAILDWLLEPAGPFDPKSTRSPKRWFVLFALLAVLMFGGFLYFNGNS
jgi:hypothetical protein